MARCKRRFFLVLIIHLDFQVPRTGVKRREYALFAKPVQKLVHSQDWLRVLESYGVQLSVVNKKTHSFDLRRGKIRLAVAMNMQAV